ncbi:signal peptide peptidase SppA [Spirochaetia bacterium]|nr:signal peptide peptidase SppA [Spirochaetia bacterium]
MGISGKYMIIGLWCLISVPVFGNGRYLELNLSERTAKNPLFASGPESYFNVFRVIERASKDKNIRGIVLNLSDFSADRAYIWELRNALEAFKTAGADAKSMDGGAKNGDGSENGNHKKIVAYFNNADMDLYLLASVADKIVMDEAGSLMFLGYVYGRGFARHAMEKLGVGVRELRYLEYKSAMETFTRDRLSEADKKQYGEYLDDIFGLTRDTLMQARSWTGEEFDAILNREYIYSAKRALDRGLADRIGRDQAVTEVIRELETSTEGSPGAEPAFALHGDPATSLMGAGSKYGPGRNRNPFGMRSEIAIIYASGNTDLDSGMGARDLSRSIRETSERRSVKAMVIRINSPGGSAEAADHIAEAVRFAKKRIPVVVSMGSVAASGGYWAGMYASHITASPYTLTGSIGVIGSWFFDQGINEKLGLSMDLLKRGNHADLMAGIILPYRDLSEDEEEQHRQYILDLYRDFVLKAAAGRSMSIEAVEAVAQGRVLSGLDAKDAGLVDSIGGLADAVRIARGLAKIGDDKKVSYNEYPKSTFFDNLLRRFGFSVSGAMGLAGMRGASPLPALSPALEDIRYRLSRNGEAMPILPLSAGEFGGRF